MAKREVGSEEHSEWVGGHKQHGECCASRREPVTTTMSDGHGGLSADEGRRVVRRMLNSQQGTELTGGCRRIKNVPNVPHLPHDTCE